MNKNVFAKCFITEEDFFPETLGGKEAVKVRQLTIYEQMKIQDMIDEKEEQTDIIIFGARCSIVDKELFDDEKVKNLNIHGLNLLTEIYYHIPLIGKTKKEIEEYEKMLEDLVKKATEKQEDEEESKKK